MEALGSGRSPNPQPSTLSSPTPNNADVIMDFVGREIEAIKQQGKEKEAFPAAGHKREVSADDSAFPIVILGLCGHSVRGQRPANCSSSSAFYVADRMGPSHIRTAHRCGGEKTKTLCSCSGVFVSYARTSVCSPPGPPQDQGVGENHQVGKLPSLCKKEFHISALFCILKSAKVFCGVLAHEGRQHWRLPSI